MNCPTCRQRLAETTYEGVKIHACGACGGEFLGPAEIAHVVKVREETFPASLHDALAAHEPTFGLSPDESTRGLACPGCRTPMHLVNYCGDTGVHVDRCPSSSGVWLDHGELEKIQVLMERWRDEAPERIRALSETLEAARRDAAARTESGGFSGSRFAFVNALINRFLDAA